MVHLHIINERCFNATITGVTVGLDFQRFFSGSVFFFPKAMQQELGPMWNVPLDFQRKTAMWRWWEWSGWGEWGTNTHWVWYSVCGLPQMPTPGRSSWNQIMGFLFPKNVLYPILSGPGTFTPWKIKMEPKNGGLEDDFPFPLVMFWFHPLIFHLHLPLKTTQKSR